MNVNYDNQKVIIRASDSGVHYGTLVHWDGGNCVTLTDSRRLWEWTTNGIGITLTEVAIAGIDQARSRISMVIPQITIIGVCEIIPAYGMACATIEGADTSTPR